MNKAKSRLLLQIFAILFSLQVIRIISKSVIFLFTPKTELSYVIASSILMLLLTGAILLFCKMKDIPLSVFPTKRKIFYIIFTVVALALLISTPIITRDNSLYAISMLMYSTIITPIFEELIFRGFVWNKLREAFHKERSIYIISTFLFAFWHIGYVDTLLFRVPNGNVFHLIFMKVIVGLGFGIILGMVRYKAKNCYSTMLLHGVMNIFGR